MIVTPGTSWKWNNSRGVTPSCAASVVPAARATGAGTNRCSRSPIGDASATIPAVAATDSWNPIDQTSHGSRITSTRTAAARIEPVARGLPISTPTSAIVAITPARITDGSAPVITTKNATVPTPRPNRGQRVKLKERGQPEDRRQHHGDVLARHHQQVAEPAGLEVAHHAGVQLRCVPQRQPEEQPRLSRREQARDGPADEGSEHLRRTDERARRRSQAFDGVAVQLDGHPLVGERIAEAGIVGPADHALGSNDVPAHPAPRVVVGAQPQGCAQRRGAARPLDPRDVERRRATRTRRPRDRCGAHRSPSRGEAPAEPATNRRATTRERPTIRRRRTRDRPSPARPR